MGFETMRRWPVFVIFAFCMFLCLSLFNSLSNEALLKAKLDELTIQAQQCSMKHSDCVEETLTLIEQKNKHSESVDKLEKEKNNLMERINKANEKAIEKENHANRTQVDVDLCKTELQSLKNLQMSKSATLDTLRLEKETLNTELTERREKIKELEKEVDRLKLALDGKTPANPPVVPKVSPAAPPAKASAVMSPPINQPAVENNAKEDEDDVNTVNDNNFNDFNDDGNK